MTPGTRLGPYEVVASLGAGGMGEVYRARDVHLGRQVALKILPELFANDPERISRFEREAQVLAALNHQNIAAIYGLERDGADSASVPRALVMELVEGPTLDERIAAGPIPLAEVLPLAAQIAEALEAAHDLGIVHRDLKPANIKLRPDGTIKVLDFGLAKIAEPAAQPASATAATYSPTMSLGATRAGMILGTAAYMAPEQARGRPVDKRADVWAFGAVFYEMLTGSKAFPGEDISDTLATVLKFDPDWSRLPDETPPPIRRLLKRCLAKDPKRRLRECGSALIDIHDVQSGADSATSVVTAPPATRRRQWWLPMMAGVALAALAGAAVWALVASRVPPAPPAVTRRFTITLPEDVDLPVNSGSLLGLSEDGRTLVYAATTKAGRQLYRRSLEQFEAFAIPGTEQAGNIFFSPDGAWLGFLATDDLKKLPLPGGPAQTLGKIGRGGRGASWSSDGRIFVAPGTAGASLVLLPETGGDATDVFKVDAAQRVSYPQVLPGGRAVLFTVTSGAQGTNAGELHVGRLDTNEHRMVLSSADAGQLLPSGHLVFMRGAVLWAVPFDSTRLETTGTPVPVIEGIRVEMGGAVQYDVAMDGTLVYIPGSAARIQRSLTLLGDDRSTPVVAPLREYLAVSLAPDQTRVAVQLGELEDADVWVVDVTRGALTRITNEPGYDGSPLWSRDGKTVVFSSLRAGGWTLNRRLADGTGPIERLLTFDAAGTTAIVRPTSWTPDGRTLLMQVGDAIGVYREGESAWKPVIDTPASESQAVVSPDGRWMAYAALEQGSSEVYVQRFPELSDRRTVSTGNGQNPSWSHDGRALFYLQGRPPRELMRVAVQTGSDGRIQIGQPQVHAEWRFFTSRGGPKPYDVGPDGRVLVMTNAVDTDPRRASRQINVVLNWQEELKRLVPLPGR